MHWSEDFKNFLAEFPNILFLVELEVHKLVLFEGSRIHDLQIIESREFWALMSMPMRPAQHFLLIDELI